MPRAEVTRCGASARFKTDQYRTVRYRTALGSARETLACLRTAEAFGYVQAVPDAAVDRMNRVVGTLVRVAA